MKTKRISSLIVFLALIVAGCVGSVTAPTTSTTPTPVPTREVAFNTPEETITYYFEGLIQGDVDKILQACAVNEMGEKFKFDLYVERVGGIPQPALSLGPTDYPLYVESNKALISSQLLNRAKVLAYGLLSSEPMDEVSFSSFIPMDAEKADTFVKDVDPHRLSTLEVKQISFPKKTLMNDAKLMENWAKTARVYGADESTERVALFSFEQQYYYAGFALLRYGENWKIMNQTSSLAGTSTLGLPQRTTVGEFDSLINK